MKKNSKTTSCAVRPSFLADEKGRTHIEILGIDFTIEASIPVTDTPRETLCKAAERNIQRPVLVSACRGKIGYSAAFPEEIAAIPAERRRKAVVSNIETELLAASHDDTPIPVLTQELVEQAAQKFWLHDAWVAWAVNEFPGPAEPGDLAILFRDMIVKCHSGITRKALPSAGTKNRVDEEVDRRLRGTSRKTPLNGLQSACKGRLRVWT